MAYNGIGLVSTRISWPATDLKKKKEYVLFSYLSKFFDANQISLACH